MERNVRSETTEVGLYLAMAWQAEREGYGEIARVFKTIAFEEARHAVRFAFLNAMISESTQENIQRMLAGELTAHKKKREDAVKARETAGDETHEVFDETSRDEARHVRALAGLLERYFKV